MSFLVRKDNISVCVCVCISDIHVFVNLSKKFVDKQKV